MGKIQRYFPTNSDMVTNSYLEQRAITNNLPYNIQQKSKRSRKHADEQMNKKKCVFIPNPNPKFRGKVPVSKGRIKKYARGGSLNKTGIRTTVHKIKLGRKEDTIKFASKQAAKAEVLLTEDSGCLEADAGETTTQFTSRQITENVDILAATKCFDLKLENFGPYRLKYTRNGRHLLVGGKRGHVAAFDWITKKLHCEINIMESLHDICWLHQETMFAVAQKDWVYIYDNQGIELHCIKKLNSVTRMEFLPYHFLLATCNETGYLGWLDISIGQLVARFNTKLGRLTMLAQNPWNAVLCIGTGTGVVSMWSPNSKDPLAKMLCHKAPLTALHVDPKGQYLATAASNREVKIWDVRKLEGPLQEYKPITAANNLCFSQSNMLALGMRNVVEVYRECCLTAAKKAYLRHRPATNIENLNFCPYEDVLGIATSKGITSLLVPGAGEPNFDAFEVNPFQTKSQRKEAEVKSLLEKIQPEFITLDPTVVAEVDVPTLKNKVEASQKLFYVKPPTISYTPLNTRKTRGNTGSVKVAKNKKKVKEQAKKEFIKDLKNVEIKMNFKKPKEPDNTVLGRFLPRKPKS